MPGIAPAVDYTARTFAFIRQRGLDLLKRRVGAYRYNALLATDTVPAIIDVVAWFHEQSAHYYDRRERNSILSLADTRESMVVLTRAQGYRMRPATSASVSVQASPSPPQPAPITLRKGTRVAVGELAFEVGADAIIPAGRSVWPDGTTDDLVVLVEGATRTETFQSDGSAFQRFELGLPGTIDGSVAVQVLGQDWDEVASLVFVEGDRRGRDTFTGTGEDGQAFDLSLLNAVISPDDEDRLVVLVQPVGQPVSAATAWLQVTSFTGAPREFTVSQAIDGTTTLTFGTAAGGSAPADGDTLTVLYLIVGAQKRYQLTYDPEDRATIRFGDGVFGVAPPAGAAITVTYRTGGGVRGNIPAGTLDASIQGYLPSGARTTVRIRNLEAGSGGNPPETVDHARFFAPKYAASNRRAVRRDDWTTLAATYADPIFGAPAHASAYLKQRVPELNTVMVAVWGRDVNGRLASSVGTPLKRGIQNMLNERRTICTSVEMTDGTVVLMDIELDVVLEIGSVRADVFAAITTAIERFFNSANVMPGLDLSISKLYTAIQAVRGVARAEITAMRGSVLAQLTLVTSADGVTNLFSGNFVLPEGTTIVPLSLVVTDGTQQVVDDGEGAFTGDTDLSIVAGDPGNANDDTTGEFSVTFTEPPTAGSVITAEARVAHYFARTELVGSSDGTASSIDGGTQYYPIVKRAPRGSWSGDQRKVIDGFQVGTTAQIRGKLPVGITPTTLVITDGAQVVEDTIGNGTLIQTAPAIGVVGTVSYTTGEINFTFNSAPAQPITATWETNTVDIFMPAEFLPLAPGRIYVWGGFDADGAQPGGYLIAYDDGDGNIAGNVLPGGTVSYETGRLTFTWNTAPPPSPAGGASFTATLSPAPDGTTRVFTFTTAATNLSTSGVDGVGRTRLQFSDLSTAGVTFEDAYDNSQGKLHGASLDPEGVNAIAYPGGTGTVTFLTAPAAGASATVAGQVTNVALVMYAGWVFRVKTPGAAGLDKGLFADNNGRFWGPPAAGPSNAYPVDRLDHLRGRFYASLAGSAIADGRDMELSYDALTGVPPALDVPIAGDEVAAVGLVAITEKPAEVNA